MSIFSSLDYLLTQAYFASLNTSNSVNFYNISDPSEFALEEEIKNTLVISTAEKYNDLISSHPSISTFFAANDSHTNRSGIHNPNEIFLDAEHLLENWWNIFDARYLKHGWGWTITLIMAYMLVLVAGVIGNLIVILVILLRPQMRSVTNLFIMNLAVADFFVIVFCVPSTLLANIFSPWILGSFMCKAVAYVQGVSGCASAYSLAAISLDRCQAIYRNCERPRGFSQMTCVKTVLIIWITALVLTIPWAVIFDVRVSEYDGLRYCVETWEVEKHGNIYFVVVNLLCFYAIPLLLIFVSNWIVYCHVTHRNVPEDSVSSTPIRKMHRETRHHVLKMLSIVTLTFLFCWLPVYVLVIIIKFANNLTESAFNLLDILMPIAQWLGSWNSCINPILYALLNKKFRRMFKSILPSWFPFQAARKHVGFYKAPNFITTAYKPKNYRRSGPNDRMDDHRENRKNIFQNQKNLLITRFHEVTGKVVTSTIQITTNTTATTDFMSSY